MARDQRVRLVVYFKFNFFGASSGNRIGYKETAYSYGFFSPACEKHCLSLKTKFFTKVNIDGTTVKDAYILWQTHLKKRRISGIDSSLSNNVTSKMKWVDKCNGPNECGKGCVTYKSSRKKKNRRGGGGGEKNQR